MAAKIKPVWLWGGAALILLVGSRAAGVALGGSGWRVLVVAVAFVGAVIWWKRWPEVKRKADEREALKASAVAAYEEAVNAPGYTKTRSAGSWLKQQKHDGARWQGVSSIFNFGDTSKAHVAAPIIGLAILLTIAAFVGAAFTIGPLILIGGALAAGAWWGVGWIWRIEKFLNERWALTADLTGFRYVSENTLDQPARWAVGWADIASVEAGRTVEWQGVRDRRKVRGLMGDGDAGSYLREIPDAEYQTFIMTRDGRRLVILTANADREGTAALALSVRAWIEAQRSGLSVRPPVGAPAPVSGPIAAAASPASTSADDGGFSL